MASLPPPQGMSEADYETIEAAVTETVRGRWFLGEFARRNRSAEMRQLLDAMARVENVVSNTQPALPPADPSIRLLMQRIREIAAQLDTLSTEMRQAGLEARFPEAVEHQARAVAGMMRGPERGTVEGRPEQARVAAPRASRPVAEEGAPPAASVAGRGLAPPPARVPRPDAPPPPTRPHYATGGEPEDPRLVALSALDGLTLGKKLALFS